MSYRREHLLRKPLCPPNGPFFLPVYIIITFGMYFLGELGLAQQAAEKAARSAAWNPQKKNKAKTFFKIYDFPNKSGPSISASASNVNLFSKNDISQAISSNQSNYQLNQGNPDLVQCVADLLNGIHKPMFKRSEANIQFSFGPRGLRSLGMVQIKARHVVTLTTNTTREAKPSQGGKGHAIEEYTGNLGD